MVRLASRALGDGALVAQCAAVGLPFAHMAAVALMLAGEYTLSEATLTDAHGRFGARGWVVPVAAAAGLRGWVRYLRGELAAAEADARQCVEEPAMRRWGIPNSSRAATLVGVHVERGELARARRPSRRSRRRATTPTRSRTGRSGPRGRSCSRPRGAHRRRSPSSRTASGSSAPACCAWA